MRARILMLAALALALAGCGVTGYFLNDPGFADFGSLKRLEGDSDFGLSLGPLPLKIANWALKDDEEMGPLLRELRAVRIYTFEGITDAQEAATGVERLTAELVGDGWLNVIAVHDEGEITSVFLRPDSNFTHHGLTVIVQEPDEVVLVNLIGNVRLDFINGYMAESGVDMPPIEIDPATLQARVITDPASPAAGIDP